MKYSLRILFVANKHDDIWSAIHQLRQGGFEVYARRVNTAVAMQSELQDHSWDVVIAFNTVTQFTPMAALGMLHQRNLSTPLIMVVNHMEEEKGIAAMAVGIQDYVTNDTLPRLAPIITRELEKADVRRERERRRRMQELLYQITKTAAAVEDVTKVLGDLSRYLRELLRADVVSLSTWNHMRNIPAAIAYSKSGNGEMREDFHVRPETRSLISRLFRLEQVLAVADLGETDAIPESAKASFPFPSFLGVPLAVSRQKLGVAFIGYWQKRTFTAEEMSTAIQAGGQIALAMARTELLVSEREQRELAETLREVAAALGSSLEREEVLSIILEQLMRVVDYDSASIMLLQNDVLQSVAHRSIHTKVQQSTALPVNDLLHIQQILSRQTPLIIADTTADSRWRLAHGTELVRCWLGVPLVLQEKAIGLLNVNKVTPDYYTEQDARVATTFAGQAAIAIENARLYAQQQAYANELEVRVAARTRDLEAANAQLQELDRLKSKFVTDVSHELRTPVTNLRLYLDLLARAGPEKQPQYLAKLQEQAERLGQLIADIMDLSRLEEGTAAGQFTAVSLNDIVQQVVETQRPQAQQRNLKLLFMPDLGLPEVWGKSGQLSQVVTNLLINALNYTLAGQVTVQTFAHASRDMVCLQVQDTGIGIDPREYERLFDRFYRGAHHRDLTVPGTGLGLAIVQEIVELHQGKIEVESTLGAGSTFRIWLPSVDA